MSAKGMRDCDEPPGWGGDLLTEFLDAARDNGYAAFVHLRSEYDLLSRLDALFRKAVEHLGNSPDWLPLLFLLRSHSAYLGAARLGLSGQLAESYPVLRAALESALYGLLIARHPEFAQIWLERDEGPRQREKVRRIFAAGRLLAALDEESRRVGSAVRDLYGRTLGYGGHPNQQALLQSLQLDREGTKLRLQLNYLTVESTAHQLCLRTVAQVGASVLEIFRLVFSERFDLVGLSDELRSATKGL